MTWFRIYIAQTNHLYAKCNQESSPENSCPIGKLVLKELREKNQTRQEYAQLELSKSLFEIYIQ